MGEASYRFQGRKGIITGASSGIGAECARQLLEQGAQVTLVDRDCAVAREMVEDWPERAHVLEMDVTSPSDCQYMCESAVEKYGELDFAINAAGVGNRDKTPVDQLAYDEWRRVMSVNADGVFLSTSAELRHMRDSGAIVNIASIMGSVATHGAAAYVASKHAVVGFTKAAALDAAPRSIRVNSIGPGYVETPLLRGKSSTQLEEIGRKHPIGRLGTTKEIADIAMFLISDAASFVTGAFVAADGGYTAQ